MGSNRSCIRELFEYGCRRAEVVGRENVYDYSLGNPSVPAPKEVNDAIRQILEDTDSVLVHGYTSAVGDLGARKAISEDLNARYNAGVKPENLFITCGAAPGLTAVFRALAVENGEILAVAPFFPAFAAVSPVNCVFLPFSRFALLFGCSPRGISYHALKTAARTPPHIFPFCFWRFRVRFCCRCSRS